jgi:hypothetical protein
VWDLNLLYSPFPSLSSLHPPHPHVFLAQDWHNQKVWVEVSNGYRLTKPEGCEQDVFDMMMRCWAADAHDRIQFEELVTFLRRRWNRLRGMPEDSGYLETNPNEEGSDTLKRSSLFGRLMSGVK